ncbi:MAG TPA: polyphosphate polymerase domain-containing protein [Syntrophomonas sp.]|nr:polyphosphate polymerase domain-containing protein [Syntrophomonas sp.]
MNTVMRQEKKFLITIEDAIKHSRYLENFMMQDSHNGTHGYMIRSLYFDTLTDRDYFEKLDGVEVRRKVRLRNYDPRSDFAVLEMKQKHGTQQLKRSLRMNRADAAEMCRGNYSPLLTYSDPFAAECFGFMHMYCYRPKTIVQYNRKAFIAQENKIRVTFDQNITATESCFDIFAENLTMYPVFNPFNVVLEIKYNGFFLSYIREFINRINRSELAVSKYCLGRSVALNYIF